MTYCSYTNVCNYNWYVPIGYMQLQLSTSKELIHVAFIIGLMLCIFPSIKLARNEAVITRTEPTLLLNLNSDINFASSLVKF